LLSAYLSYRWTRSAKPRSYILEMTLFVLALSLFSANFPVSDFFPAFVSTFPFSFLSWPAYSWSFEFRAPEVLNQYYIFWVYSRGVSFLTLDVTSTPEWEYRNSSLITNNLWSVEQYLTIFSILLLINIAGALFGAFLGILSRKKSRMKDTSGWWMIAGVVGLVLFLLFVLAFGRGDLVIPSLFGLGVILLETVILSPLLEMLAHYRVAALMVLGGLNLLLIGLSISNIVMIIVGSFLFLAGAVIYFFEFAIAYARAHPVEEKPDLTATPSFRYRIGPHRHFVLTYLSSRYRCLSRKKTFRK